MRVNIFRDFRTICFCHHAVFANHFSCVICSHCSFDAISNCIKEQFIASLEIVDSNFSFLSARSKIVPEEAETVRLTYSRFLSPSVEESVLHKAIMESVQKAARQNADVLKTLNSSMIAEQPS